MGEGQGSLGGSEAGWELGLSHRWRILRERGPVQIHTSIATVRGFKPKADWPSVACTEIPPAALLQQSKDLKAT